eukprot:sb/3472041/
MGYATGVPAGHLTRQDLNDESLDMWFVKSYKKLRVTYAKDNQIFTTTTLSLGTWNHYTVTFNTNSSGLKIYENGVETVSRDDLASYPILKTGYQVFGQDQDRPGDPSSFNSGQSCTGRVKQPYFSSDALRSDEVASLYSTGVLPTGVNMINSLTGYGDIDISYTICEKAVRAK